MAVFIEFGLCMTVYILSAANTQSIQTTGILYMYEGDIYVDRAHILLADANVSYHANAIMPLLLYHQYGVCS